MGLTLPEAEKHVAAGASVWEWAGTEKAGEGADVVLACSGDVPTMETMAAAMLLRERCPKLRVRVVNVVDIMMLSAPGAGACRHDHAMSEEKFEEFRYGHSSCVFLPRISLNRPRSHLPTT